MMRWQEVLNRLNITFIFFEVSCVTHNVCLCFINSHVHHGSMQHTVGLHKTAKIQRILTKQCRWMMKLKNSVVNSISAIRENLCHQLKNTNQRFYILKSHTGLHCCAAIFASHLTASCCSSSAEHRRLKMADSWRPRHYWFFTHIKHWPIYCADWQAGKQSESSLFLKTSSSYFWNTHWLVCKHYRSLRDQFLSFRSCLFVFVHENAKQQNCSCYTDPQYAKLSAMISQTSFCLACFDRMWCFYRDIGLYKCLKKQTHQLNSDITGHVFTFLLHKILIYPWRAGIFSALSNINAEFEWLTHEETLILSPWQPSNGPPVGGGLHKPNSSFPWLGHTLCLTWL